MLASLQMLLARLGLTATELICRVGWRPRDQGRPVMEQEAQVLRVLAG